MNNEEMIEYCKKYIKENNFNTSGYDNWKDVFIDICLKEDK